MWPSTGVGHLAAFPHHVILPRRFACVQYIFTHCHVYDKDQNYVPFDANKPEALFEVQRKVLPETM